MKSMDFDCQINFISSLNKFVIDRLPCIFDHNIYINDGYDNNERINKDIVDVAILHKANEHWSVGKDMHIGEEHH